MLLDALFAARSDVDATQATLQLLARLAVPVTRATIVASVESHPDHPSLLSIAESLAEWGVETEALRVEPASLSRLPVPFVAHLRRGGGSFAVVTATGESVIRSIDSAGRERAHPRADFERDWSGVVLLAERAAASGEPDYVRRRRRELLSASRGPLVLAVLFALTLAFAAVGDGRTLAWASLMLLVKLVGAAVTALLLLVEVGGSPAVLRGLCPDGPSAGCSKVLASRQAKVLGAASWSEVGFVYFAGGFLLLVTSGHAFATSFAWLAWLNLAAVPVIVLSMLHQWTVARAWCALCLATQGVLLAELAIATMGYWTLGGASGAAAGDAGTMVAALACFTVPALVWALVRTPMRAAFAAPALRRERDRLRRDRHVFDALLRRRPAVSEPPPDAGITLGDIDARHRVVVVCNPYCAPCARMHASLETLLGSGADVKVQVLFTATDDDRDPRAAPVRLLLALHATVAPAVVRAALCDWFAQTPPRYDAFAAKYRLNGEVARQGATLTAMSRWCAEAGIAATPAVFVDGYPLPPGYEPCDLRRLLR